MESFGESAAARRRGGVMRILPLLLLAELVSDVKAWPKPGTDDNEVGEREPVNFSSLGDGAYGKPQESFGDRLKNWSPETSKSNPEEQGGYAEGDILFPLESKRNGIKGESYRWPKGIIPYIIEGSFSSKDRETIMKAIAEYHRLTCLRFVQNTGQYKDYIAITSKQTGCWSSVGKIGGRQELNLQSPGCLSLKGTVLHEFMHAAGFMHEHSRPERDNFVDVYMQNVSPNEAHNFKKASAVEDYRVIYDYNSVMHYSKFAFSANGKPTMKAKGNDITLGQRVSFSRGDVTKLNAMYKCNKDVPANGWKDDVWVGSDK